MKYPLVYILRFETYKHIDRFIEVNKDKFDCTIKIIDTKDYKLLNNLFDSSVHILITYGGYDSLYTRMVHEIIVDRMRHRWIHKKTIDNIDEFNSNVNYCYIENVIKERKKTRPIFSIFTSCYNSYEKINRAYNSIKLQTLKDWEWVILDDSPEDKHFDFLRKIAQKDKRIRLYKRDCNSGNIGNVKNETIGLCRGRYLLELDHDDIILPDVLKDAANVFENDKDVGFIYMDFINVYEDWRNFKYGDFICKGYGGYYMQKYNNRWVYVYITPNINNITLSHLVCLPNHPRIWRRDTMYKLENYSEFLPICDDYEILLRTALNTKIVKIHKLGYVQFMNDGRSNFSLIRNGEINRIGPYHIQPQFFRMYNVHKRMKELDAYEHENYINRHSKIWTRKNYTSKYVNTIINHDFKKQICLLGLETLNSKNCTKDLYNNKEIDIMLLDNKFSNDFIIQVLERKSYPGIKFYTLPNESKEVMENYFMLMCKHNDNVEILSDKTYNQRHEIINEFKDGKNTYLEIGIEYGHTFNNVQIPNKTGVDPDPKVKNNTIVKKTSDEFFEQNTDTFDVIFIDGMHQTEFVLRDFNNSVNCLNKNGLIFLDDILPINEREQKKIPIKHTYENGILKYRESWTGDVWKLVYYLLKNYNEKIEFEIFTNKNYRGVLKISLNEKINISPDALSKINNYSYEKDFIDYYMYFI